MYGYLSQWSGITARVYWGSRILHWLSTVVPSRGKGKRVQCPVLWRPCAGCIFSDRQYCCPWTYVVRYQSRLELTGRKQFWHGQHFIQVWASRSSPPISWLIDWLITWLPAQHPSRVAISAAASEVSVELSYVSSGINVFVSIVSLCCVYFVVLSIIMLPSGEWRWIL